VSDGARVTVKVNAWVAVPYLFLAVRVSGYTPAAGSTPWALNFSSGSPACRGL
jgi:hypothetical protein